MAFESIRQEWKQFKNDRPGERFKNHRRRMEHHRISHHALRAAAGSASLAVGTMMLLAPGPGLLTIGFGLALIAGTSRRVARTMDRAEPRIQAWLRRLTRRPRTAVAE